MGLRKLVGMALASLMITSTAEAREPGVGPSFPAGLTIGIPTGALPPPGTYVLQRFNYSSGNIVDGDGNDIGVSVDAKVASTQINFSTDWELFGGRYMTFIAFPYMVDLDVSTPGGSTSSSGLLNPMWKHLLSWNHENGWYTSAGLGIYLPIGDDDVAPQFDYILEPEFAVSYLSKDWQFTGQAVFNINGENSDTAYKSGNEMFLNATAVRNFGKFSIGPTAYYTTQLTSDRNNGSNYGGVAAGDAEAFALGLHASYNFGPFVGRLNYTNTVKARNTVDEENLWVHLEFKF